MENNQTREDTTLTISILSQNVKFYLENKSKGI